MNREIKPDDLYDETIPIIEQVIALQKLIEERDLYKRALELVVEMHSPVVGKSNYWFNLAKNGHNT